MKTIDNMPVVYESGQSLELCDGKLHWLFIKVTGKKENEHHCKCWCSETGAKIIGV